MNVATGGFGTEITAQTDEGMKNNLGGAAYLLTGELSESHGATQTSTPNLQICCMRLSWLTLA